MERRCVRSDAFREHLHRDGLVPDDVRDPEARRRVQRLTNAAVRGGSTPVRVPALALGAGLCVAYWDPSGADGILTET